MEKSHIHCRVCHEIICFQDPVDIDIMNSITHQTCEAEPQFAKDSGTFEKIAKKYPFFNILN